MAWRQLSLLQWHLCPKLLNVMKVFMNLGDLKWESPCVCKYIYICAHTVYVYKVYGHTLKKKKSTHIHIITWV